ncbi:MAG: ester cyclase [Ruegeria sp.]
MVRHIHAFTASFSAISIFFAGTLSANADSCSLEQKKELAYQAIELWLSGTDIDPNAILAPGYTNHVDSAVGLDTAEQVRDVAAFQKEVAKFHAAFTDVKALSRMQVAEGDMVATRVQLSAVHSGSYLGEEATGNTIKYDSVEFTRIADCKVAETWVTWDKYAMFYQIGLIPNR